MREPDVVAEPADVLEVLDRPHPEHLEAERLLLDGLGHVRVQPHAALAGVHGGLGHQLARHAERRARRQRDPAHRARGGIVELAQRRLVGGEDRVTVLDDRVRRQPAGRRAQVHRPAARVEADPQLARRLDLRPAAGRRPRGRRSDGRTAVVQPDRSSAASPARAAARSTPLVDPRPDRIELDEPLEERRLLRQPARRVLVEVVMAVDQARRRQAAGAVDPLAALRAPGPARPRPCRLPSITTCPSRCTSPATVATAQPSMTIIGRRQPHRVEDLLVARAAAQVAGQRLADLRVRGRRLARQQVVRRDDQPRRAEPALHRAGLQERLLHRVQLVLGSQPLDGHHLAPLGLPRRDQARAHQLAVQIHRARPALALLARVLGARQLQPLAQHVRAAIRPPRARRPRAARR